MFDISARWIWHGGEAMPNEYLIFPVRFDGVKGKQYELTISVDSQYAVYLNGVFAEWGQWGDFPEYKTYDTIDLTDKVTEGENLLEIESTWYGADTFSYRKEPAGLIFTLTADGDTVAVSDGSCVCVRDTRYMRENVQFTTPQIGWGFRYDSTKPLPAAEKAVEVNKPATLVPRPIKKLTMKPKKPAVMLTRGGFIAGKPGKNFASEAQSAYLGYQRFIPRPTLPSGGVTVKGENDGVYVTVDLGEECAGLLDMDFTVTKETRVLVTWGEHLDDCRVRSDIRCFCDEYIAHEGENSFIYPMRRLGLRYLQVFFFSGGDDVVIRYLGVDETDYPVDGSGKFLCSDNLHNRIAEVSKRTLLMCMHEHYEDCPWREQALYNMDSRNQMLFGYYAFGETEFPKASLKLFSLGVRDEDGLIDICAPSRFQRTIPSFNAIFPMQAAEYLRHSGDKKFLREILPKLKRVCETFEDRIDDTGLVRKFEDDSRYWDFFEWQTGLEGNSRNTDAHVYSLPLNAFFSMACAGMMYICDQIGDDDGAEHFAALYDGLNAVINNKFWDSEKKEYYTYIVGGVREHKAELSQALAVCCGAAQRERLDACLDILSRTVGGVDSGLAPVPPDDDMMHPVTISHLVYKYEALMKRPERYGRLVFADIARVFGYMLYRQATTFWETIDGGYAFGDAGSLCHGWSAVPIYMYWRYGAGYRIEDRTIAPVDCSLGEIKAVPPKGLREMFE